ncbi:MAG: ATP-binding protein, partial [Firmicutes bacterium]|nr:ATP-binding protein [Bacillota bacterium]
MVLLFTPVATTAFVIMEQKNSCSILLKSVTTYADIAAHSVAADLDFPWGSGPSGALTSLEPNKNIRMACVWDKDGRFFLGYPANYPKTSFPQTLPKADSHRFTSNSLEVFRVIKRHDRPVGMIYLQSNLDEIHDRLWTDAKIVVIVFMLLVLFASITAQFMHRHIAEPLLELSQAAQEVSEGKDYSMRLAKKMGGEIGTLTDSLNEMLAQIQSRDMRLTDYQNHLEDQVSQRSEQLIKANSQLLLSKEKAEEANRAKSTFLANMSHELRTPLNAILLYSELLADDLQEREIAELLPDIGKIQSSGKHLLSLIDEILDLSKIEAGRMTVFLEDCDLVALFKEIDATIGPLAARNNNRVIMDLDENLPSIRTDARMLRQVLYNLLNNAAKFTQGGEIHMKAFAEWSWGVFQVADTGIGMSEAQVRKIFREFTQGDESTTRRFGGTGLGLSLCRKLATLMGGELTVVSELE